MIITKDILSHKRNMAVAKRESLLSEAAAQLGVISALDHLIAMIDQPEPYKSTENQPEQPK